MKVSIIIPYKTDRGFLDAAIESVHNQNYRGEIELILSQSDNGVSYNLNRGIEDATGDLIKYLCDDDRLTINSIRDSVRAIEGYDFIHGNAFNFDDAIPSRSRSHTPFMRYPNASQLAQTNHIHGGTLMYRRDVFERFGMFDESLWTGEEYEFNMRILSQGAKIGYSDATLYNYRLHPLQKSIGLQTNEYRARRAAEIERIKQMYR
jgi:teichuronic acid biosynthesis glycosyltransferase TuaG